MKYKIEIYGRGGDTFIHQLTDEQYQKLYDEDVESDTLDIDQINEILEIEDFSDTSEAILGLFNGLNHGEYMGIEVKNEADEVVWTSGDDFNFEDVEYSHPYQDGHYLAISDYQKGLFFTGEFETDEEFDFTKLSGLLVDSFDEKIEVINGVKYDGQEVELDFGDTDSKGFSFFLI